MIKEFLINIIYIYIFKETFFYSFVHVATLVIDFHVWVPVYVNCVVFATVLNLCSPLVMFAKIVLLKLINIYWVENLFFFPFYLPLSESCFIKLLCNLISY